MIAAPGTAGGAGSMRTSVAAARLPRHGVAAPGHFGAAASRASSRAAVAVSVTNRCTPGAP
jgi:hypothetical protein